jgi:hypothetical protein
MHILDKIKKLAKDKHSSLFWVKKQSQGKKILVMSIPGKLLARSDWI